MKNFLRGLAAPILAFLAISFAVPAFGQVVHIAGSDGSTNREVPVTATGALITSTAGTAGGSAGSATAAGQMVGGTDGTLYRNLSVNTAGQLYVNGPNISGTSLSSALGLMVGGSDGTNYRHLAVDATGRLSINVNSLGTGSSVASGASDLGGPVKIGGVYNSTLPTFTTGQRGDVQISPKGDLHAQLYDGAGNAAGWIFPSADGASSSSWSALTTVTAPYLFNGSNSDRLRSLGGASSTGVGVAAVGNVPGSSTALSILPTNGSAVASSQVLKASAGNLYRVSLVAGASAGFLMVFDATSAPVDGAVTPKVCRPVAANGVLDLDFSGAPYRFTTGITAVFSTTGCFSKTASATAYFEGLAL